MDFSTLSIQQLQAAEAERLSTIRELANAEAPTVEQLQQARTLQAEVVQIRAALAEAQASLSELQAFTSVNDEGEGTEAQQAAEEHGDEQRVMADAEEVNDTTTVGGSGSTAHEETVQESPGQVVEPGQQAPAEGGTQAAGSVAQLAARTRRPAVPDQPRVRRSAAPTIRVAPDVSGFSAGQRLDNTLSVAEAVLARAQGFPTPNGTGVGEDLRKFPTASFSLDIPAELMVEERSSDAHEDEVMDLAVDESRLPGGSLTAAAGWCAPSETMYDLSSDTTVEGILSLPEVGVRRGGMRWAVTPSFDTFYANPGFFYTEAQMISGQTKPCVTIDCPSFDEKRLDVEGLCIKVPILTNVGYPEYVRLFVDETLKAHQHWINANVIGQLVTEAGAARVLGGLGSTVIDTLNGLEIMGERMREKYRLTMNRTLEVVAPFWIRAAIRADLAARGGVPFEAVTDQQIRSHFAARKLNLQFVYDWQMLPQVDDAGTAGVDESIGFPATFNVLMYPAGTFVKGTSPVINLNTVYDAASLATNTYTGLFTEQAFLIAKKKFHVDLFTLPVCNAGRTGVADLTCA